MPSFPPAVESGSGLFAQVRASIREAVRGISNACGEKVSSWRASGAERVTGTPLNLAFAGNERHKSYFFRMALRPGWKEEETGKMRPESLVERLEAGGRECDALFLEVSEGREPSFEVRTHFRIPAWVESEIALPESPEGLCNRRCFANLRRCVRKNSWTFRYEPDPAELKRFYDTMYVPFSLKSHGEAAYVYSFAEVKARFLRGELLLAQSGELPAAGMIMEYGSGQCRLSCLGVDPAREELLRDGVISALYFKAMERAVGKGIKLLNLGYSKPFLRDGAFRFKARIGARVLPEYHRGSGFLTIRMMKRTPGLESFLERNPFINLDAADRPHGVFFCREGRTLDAAEISGLLSDSLCGGLESIDIFTFGDAPSPAPQQTPGICSLKVRAFSELEPAARGGRI